MGAGWEGQVAMARLGMMTLGECSAGLELVTGGGQNICR